VDLLVIMPFDGDAHEMALRVRRRARAAGGRFGLDLLVRTPRFIADRLREKDCFVQEIIANGRTLYDGDN
jgi:hypothetical protein